MNLIGTGYQIAGKTSQVLVGGSALTYASWEAAMKGDDLPTVNFQSYNITAAQTFGEGIIGPIDCDIKFGGDWDAGTNPLDEPPGLYPRDDLSSVSFVTNRVVAPSVAWDFDFVRLRSSTSGADVKGKVTFNTSGMNQGPFAPPVGSIA